MSEISSRFAAVADGFDAVAAGVPDDGWENPAPCEGWAARDVLRHIVEWIPSYFAGTASLVLEVTPAVDTDPVGAWRSLRAGLAATLQDSSVADRVFEGHSGPMTIAESIDMIVTGDLLIHTWDLAVATGQTVALDVSEVHRMLVASEPFDAVLRTSGHYGPRVEIPDGSSEQDQLIAFMGRDPFSSRSGGSVTQPDSSSIQPD